MIASKWYSISWWWHHWSRMIACYISHLSKIVIINHNCTYSIRYKCCHLCNVGFTSDEAHFGVANSHWRQGWWNIILFSHKSAVLTTLRTTSVFKLLSVAFPLCKLSFQLKKEKWGFLNKRICKLELISRNTILVLNEREREREREKRERERLCVIEKVCALSERDKVRDRVTK